MSEANPTPVFVYNDGGRKAAGYKGSAGDCVCRAIAIAAQLPYQQVYDRLAEGNATQRKSKRTGKQSRSARNGIYTKRKWFKDYMLELGFIWVPTITMEQSRRLNQGPFGALFFWRGWPDPRRLIRLLWPK
jgi:hypothetical protein